MANKKGAVATLRPRPGSGIGRPKRYNHLTACRTALLNHFHHCTQCNPCAGDVYPLTYPPCDVGLACIEELVIAKCMSAAEHEAGA